MSELRRLNQRDLEDLLKQVMASHCSASLRIDGTARMLGQLQVRALEPGLAIQLEGAKHRDRLPAAGTPVTLSFLLDQEVVSLRTTVLEPASGGGRSGRQPVLRAAWPSQALEYHKRDEVRVAAPELPSLGATLICQDQRVPAKLLNLTETGIGLGLKKMPPFPLLGEMQVDTLLPGGTPLHLMGDVRHWEELERDALPVRVGLVLRVLPAEAREALRGMVQARRIIRSEAIRDE